LPVRLLGLSVTSPTFQLYAIPGAFAPAIAAIVVRVFGGEGFKDAGFKLPLFSKWPYFLFALLLPFAVIAAIIVEAQQLGLAQPDYSMPMVAKMIAAKGVKGLSPESLFPLICLQVLITAILATPILWGEEFGWRGYLQPRLFPGKPVLAAIATGIIWAVWHYPLIFRGYNYGADYAVGSVVFIGFCILISFIFGWLVEKTGSIWSSSLAHSATNAIGGSLTLLLFGATNPTVVSYAGLLAFPPFLVVCLGVLLFGRRRKPASGVAEEAAA
jgi:membrane protease YdiL (CAAX protease family)